MAGSQWLTPVILVTQKAEIRKIMASNQPQENSWGDPILKIFITKKGW
jgi:hypothetical protein